MAENTVSPVHDKAVREATGKGSEEWFAILDAAGAREMPHKEIAQWLAASSAPLADPALSQWITIAYEKRIGRRVTGQDCYGNFFATASRAVAGDLDFALDAWLRRVEGVSDFNGLALAGAPKVSKSEKFRYWRGVFDDGSTINIVINAKGAGKCTVAVDHRKLAGEDAVGEWKAFWKEFLAVIA